MGKQTVIPLVSKTIIKALIRPEQNNTSCHFGQETLHILFSRSSNNNLLSNPLPSHHNPNQPHLPHPIPSLQQPHSLIPNNLHRNREWRNTPPVLPQIRNTPILINNLLQLPLRTRRTTDILVSKQSPEHLRQRNVAHLPAQIPMSLGGNHFVTPQRPGRVHHLRVGEVVLVFADVRLW